MNSRRGSEHQLFENKKNKKNVLFPSVVGAVSVAVGERGCGVGPDHQGGPNARCLVFSSVV